MSTTESTSPSLFVKPKHLQRGYARQFQDQSVVDVYHLRPPYPEQVFSILTRLIDPDCRRVLDVGCGTGEIARRITLQAEQVDAVDFSPAMIAKGKRSPGGDTPSLHWIEGDVETVPLAPSYGLITAAASLHWMDWSIVLPRFARSLTPKGVLAIILEESGPVGLSLEELWQRVRDYSTNRDYEAFDLIVELTQRGVFAVEGEEWTEPIVWEQSIPDYVASFHARNGFSYDRLGAEASEAFDTQATQILKVACPEGKIPLQVRARVVWGPPFTSAPHPPLRGGLTKGKS